jgi:TetR/AcrR family transcriptional regulator, cholesterol catabolism regulator
MKATKHSSAPRNLRLRPRTQRLLPEDRWAQICEAATRLFYVRGFHGTSMQDISDVVGVRKGSLYHYITSKEELLFQVLKSLHEESASVIEQVRYRTGRPLEELKRYLKSMTVHAGAEADRLSIFFHDFQFILPAQQREIISERDIYVKVTERLISEAVKLRVVASSIHVRVAARTIMSTVTGTREWYRPTGAMRLEDIAEQIADFLVSGLVGYGSAGRRNRRTKVASSRNRGAR